MDGWENWSPGEERRDREEEEEGKDASYAGGLTPWEAASG